MAGMIMKKTEKMNGFGLAGVVLVVVCVGLLCGCVRRTISIDSDPQGALVYLNDEEVGRTPVVVPFLWYGVYDVRLMKDGYETLSVGKEAKAPLCDYPVIDLVAEALPGTVEVELKWQFKMEPGRVVSEEYLVDHAYQMRAMLDKGE